ncbi:hypothetical protein QQ020_19295 [Fulvivirgaceae bacterium BMA12]|uniref:Uncharacterized protein n=1 Tax=Agaribacillus aureus TaxID=3051825 RepID=A0ABT8LB86_9BACT|nr:hypothetical protein [Fulvivirgaceae bacterium BMA12]
MSTNKNYFDLIDSYLNGKMTSHEAIEFENQLQKDPLLESKFQLQKDIVDSIRNFRKAELKATLNAVEVGVGGSFTILKVAAGLGVMALLGIGIYYFTGNTENSDLPEISNNEISENNQGTVEKENTPIADTKHEKDIAIKGADKQITNVTEKKEKSEPVAAETKATENKDINDKSSNIQEVKKPVQPEIKLPEVVEDFDKEEGQISENIKVPENKLNQVTETYLPKTEVVEMDHRKYAFHYQFYNNKLYLYGKFDNKYEILELNTPTGISIYMFYKENFYELEQNQEKITPLSAIEDGTLIRDLKTIRDN